MSNVYKMVEHSSIECNSIKRDFHETPNMHPNLSTTPLNDEQFRLDKINEIKYYLLRRLQKEN